MATTIVTKSGSGAPTASNLVAGELAVDLTNKRLYTENSGGTVLELGTNPASDVTFGDNTKAVFGDGSDLRIYHTGSHSTIENIGTGHLQIHTTDFRLKNSAGTESMILANADGNVQLYYDNAEKLATTATGIDVTGSVTASAGLTVTPDSGANAANFRTRSTNDYSFVNFYSNDGSENLASIGIERTAASTSGLHFYVNNGGQYVAKKMSISPAGNVGIGVVPSAWGSFYSTINAGSAGNLAFFTGQTNAPVANVGVNLYNDNTNFRYAATGAASFYQQYVGEHRWYNVASGGVGNIATPVQAMTLDASGRVTMPYQPAFSARPTSAQNDIANNESQVTLSFGTEIFDAGSNFASNVFTAPVTGKYQFNVLIYVQNLDSAATYFLIAIKTSNRTYLNIQSGASLGADASYYTYTLSILADMDASDTAYIFAQQAGGTSQVDIDTDSFFTGYLVA